MQVAVRMLTLLAAGLMVISCGSSQTLISKPTETAPVDSGSGGPSKPEGKPPAVTVATATSELLPTPPPTQVPPATAEPPAAPVERVRVSGTGSAGLNLRSEPSTAAERVKTLPDSAELEVIGEDRQADGRTWRNVRDPSDGATGWVAAEFLSPVSGR